MKSRVILAITLLSFLVLANYVMAEPAHAAVKCSCPSIDADGEGNTSCSTSESGGRCTIDYNLFSEREHRAADILGQLLGMEFPADGNLDTYESLVRAEQREEVLEQIQLYLSIAAVDQLISHEETVPIQELLAVLDQLHKYEEDIMIAFSAQMFHRFLELEAYELEQPESFILVDEDDVVIAYGCISVMTHKISVMFKAWSSPTRAIPHCRRYE